MRDKCLLDEVARSDLYGFCLFSNRDEFIGTPECDVLIDNPYSTYTQLQVGACYKR